MKSIQTKFIALILGCVLLSALVIGGAGVLNAQRVVDEDSARIMNLICEERTQELDALLSRIEQSVRTLAIYTLDQIEDVDMLKSDPAYVDAFSRQMESVAINAASNTEGAMAVYIRYNPAFTAPTSGLFWSKTNSNGSFQPHTPTDFSSFNPSDVEHVGWYYIPVKSGKATWMDPYFNQNINVQMISYVIPLYKNNETIGVVGMDIDFSVLTSSVQDMRAYDSGYAFLTDAVGNVFYHPSIAIGTPMTQIHQSLAPLVAELANGTTGSSLFSYQWQNHTKKMAFRTLSNGMRLAVTAPNAEIDASKNELVSQILIAALLISTLALVLTIETTRRIIRPLRELNAAAQKIAAGDLSITLSHQTKDEVGTLSDSFQRTVSHLQQYIDYINGLAYRDSLTGVKNKTAYQDAVQRMEDRMRVSRPEFAVVVFDLNDLKKVNDTFGHDFGDILLLDACKTICKVFRRSPVYRIGGDEFVTILEGSDFERYQELLTEFEATIEEQNHTAKPDNYLSIARGIAVYNAETDMVFGNVFKRADDAMYQNKSVMKQKLTTDPSEK